MHCVEGGQHMGEGTSTIGRWVLAGLGLAALTRDKAEELIQELARRGEMSREEAREIGRQIRERGETEWAEWRQYFSNSGQKFFTSAGLVTRAEFQELKQKVKELEERLDRLGTVQ